MTRFRKLRISSLAAAVLLPAALAWSYAEFASARAGAVAAERQAAMCDEFAAQIARLRELAPQSKATSSSAADLATQLEEVLRTPSLTGVRLIRIDPHSPKRVGDSTYAERITQLEFQQVSLRQLATLYETFQKFDSRCRISRIRLQSPSRESTPPTVETWNVELTLTAWEFTPKNTTAGNTSTSRR
jgi:hypothetical protein